MRFPAFDFGVSKSNAKRRHLGTICTRNARSRVLTSGCHVARSGASTDLWASTSRMSSPRATCGSVRP
eukprot:2317229-Rhodomonas_salina.1